MSLSVLPFSLRLPQGYSLAAPNATSNGGVASNGGGGSSGPSSTTTPVQDVVSISSASNAGTYTAVAGDTISLSTLFQGVSGTSSPIMAYRLALGSGGGQLTLDGADVSSRTSFTADEFSRLSYTAGATGTQQSIVVAAQTGKLGPSGSLTQTVDSPAVQIESNVTGTRSINAMSALRVLPSDADSSTVGLVKQAAILNGGFGAEQPTLRTSGNFTAAAGDSFRIADLFQGTASARSPIAGYQLALGAGGGQLTLNGADVSGQTSFTPAEFASLIYTTGATNTQQNLTVVAQAGVSQANGTLSQVVDSQAVQIAAQVTGTRSINAMAALTTTPSDGDANTVSIVKEAAILDGGFGTAQPSLQTNGNFTAAAGDVFRLGDLFQAAAPTGKSIAGYRVALGQGDGQLTLNGTDVAGQTNFTAGQFADLSYTAGTNDTRQSLVVVAQTGVALPDGTLGQVVDSPAMQIEADVTGTRSVNAMNAMTTVPTGPDAYVVNVVKQAAILSGGFGVAPPTLQTQGNFTAAAGDSFRLDDLFQAGTPTGKPIAGYNVALGDGGGTLTLNGVDVSGRTSFSADEFANLSYTAGAMTSRQSLTVVAQTGTVLANGALGQEVDSPAVQITANVTGTRSLNAMSALITAPSGADASTVGLVKEAGILHGGFGTVPPTLRTDGNFTAAAGDTLRVGDLFHASAPAGSAITGYRVALDAGGGQLTLNGTDVSSQTGFTAGEFADLLYTAGANGTSQDITVAAQTGVAGSDGTLSQVVDSPAVQITADVSGTRSVNAMAALTTVPVDANANVVSLVKEAAILAGGFGTARPTLGSVLSTEPALSPAELSEAVGAYSSTGPAQTAATDIASLYPEAVGNSSVPGVFANPGGPVAMALLLLDIDATGAFRTGNNLAAQSVAIRAYNLASGV